MASKQRNWKIISTFSSPHLERWFLCWLWTIYYYVFGILFVSLEQSQQQLLTQISLLTTAFRDREWLGGRLSLGGGELVSDSLRRSFFFSLHWMETTFWPKRWQMVWTVWKKRGRESERKKVLLLPTVHTSSLVAWVTFNLVSNSLASLYIHCYYSFISYLTLQPVIKVKDWGDWEGIGGTYVDGGIVNLTGNRENSINFLFFLWLSWSIAWHSLSPFKCCEICLTFEILSQITFRQKKEKKDEIDFFQVV